MRNLRELQALDVLERFPCTSRAVARITGMPNKSASSVLSSLYRLGALKRERIDPSGRSRPPYLYSIRRPEKNSVVKAFDSGATRGIN